MRMLTILAVLWLSGCSQWQSIPEAQPVGRTESDLTQGLLPQIDTAINLSDLQTAETLVRRGLQIDPYSPALMTRLAQVRCAQGRTSQCQQAVEKARTLEPSARDTETLNYLAKRLGME